MDNCQTDAQNAVVRSEGSGKAVAAKKNAFVDVFHGSHALAIRVDDIYQWMDFLAIMDEQAATESSFVECHRYPRKWVFRGQANAEWDIKSSFEVAIPESMKAEADLELVLREKERRSYIEFRRFGHEHVHGMGKMNFPEWLTYMQHFGVKTRMIDFTESPLTALYFSQEDKNQNGDFAVWGVCISALSPYESLPEFKKLRKDGLSMPLIKDLVRSLFEAQSCTTSNVARQWGRVTELFENESDIQSKEPEVFYFYPRWHNQRSSAQSGLFMMSSHLSKPFQKALMRGCSNEFDQVFPMSAVMKHSELSPKEIAGRLRVVKFVFKKELRDRVQRLLKLMDKNPRTIYPDIHGLAKSLENPMMIK